MFHAKFHWDAITKQLNKDIQNLHFCEKNNMS